jgi:predicted ATPase
MANIIKKPTRIALTGGPGVGKSTVLEILAHQGHAIVPEAARLVIERESLKDSDCLPWKNLQLFQNTASNLQFELENSARGDIIFSDRGIVDGYAYSKLDGILVPEVILSNGRNRYDLVFILNQLPNYQTDSSRKEDISKAKTLHEAIYSAYLEFGYNPIEVPVLSPEERAIFILNKLEKLIGVNVVGKSTT